MSLTGMPFFHAANRERERRQLHFLERTWSRFVNLTGRSSNSKHFQNKHSLVLRLESLPPLRAGNGFGNREW